MLDLHIHSKFSPDSQSTLQDILNFSKHLKIIAITDHYDLKIKGKDFKIKDVKEYVSAINSLNGKFKTKVLCGIEVGMQPDVDFDLDYKIFDYVIGSIHSVKDLDNIDKQDPNFVVKKFLESTYYSIQNNNYFHSLGHLDYVLRYVSLKTLKPYKNEVLDILKLLIKKGKALEVNTSGYLHGLNRSHPEWWIIEQFHEFGGGITIGSDAHKPYTIGYKVEETILKLKEIGFKEITYFEKGEPKCVVL